MSPVLHDGHELAATLGASYADVMSWARRGIIPRIKTGRRVVFNLTQVVEALRANQAESAPAMSSTEE